MVVLEVEQELNKFTQQQVVELEDQDKVLAMQQLQP
jgi:hypothetical protein